MKKTTQDRIWAVLSKDERDGMIEAYKSEAINADYERGWNYAVRSIFGEHNLMSDTEPEEMLVVERKKVQELYDGLLNEKDAVSISTPYGSTITARLQILKELFGDKCLPDKEESRNNSQFIANCDKSEDNQLKDNMEGKELNLNNLLKDCKGEKIFSTFEGDMTIVSVTDSKIILHGHNTDLVCGNGFYASGICQLWPSRELYEKYPLDPYSAWMEWKESRRQKYILEVDVSLWFDGEDGRENEAYDGKKWFHFDSKRELEQAAEAIRETLTKFHEQN